MKAVELFEKYPKAAEVVIQYYADKFLKSVENIDVPEEFKEFAKQQRIDDQYVADFIDNNPRGTFDMFDANEVYIEINITIAESPRFTYHVNGEINIDSFYNSRKEAEAVAVQTAFQILNEKL
jgi:hypothetical protein